MTRLSFSTVIERPLGEVYETARRLERHPEIIPDYLSCRIVERRAEDVLVERTAAIRGKVMRWRSWATFRPNQGVYFIHQGGRLDGMQVNWEFEALDAERTRMTITQIFAVRVPVPGLGRFLERRIFGPKLSDIGQRVVESFKRACEAQIGAAV